MVIHLVVLYTIHCPNCIELENELKKNGIKYQICDDIEKMRKMGFRKYPILEVDSMLFDYENAMEWIIPGNIYE